MNENGRIKEPNMLYIMRHGRTVWNMEHKMQGKTDVPLSEAGRSVVEQAAAAYRDTHIDVCYCSPLIRAVETAEIVLRGREVPLITAGEGHPDRGPRCHECEHCVPDQGHPREGLLEREDEKRGAGAAALSASL